MLVKDWQSKGTSYLVAHFFFLVFKNLNGTNQIKYLGEKVKESLGCSM